MTDLYRGFLLMIYGLVGVFSVLILFYLMIKGLMKFFTQPKKQD